MGTGAWALWADTGKNTVEVRHYDARMVIPLTWDEEGVTECAFVTRVFYRGKAVDQLQLHLIGNLGTYRIDTVCFDSDGNQVEAEGILPSYETGSLFATFFSSMIRLSRTLLQKKGSSGGCVGEIRPKALMMVHELLL